MTPRELLIESFRVAVASVQAEAVLPVHLPPPPQGKTFVVGAGKAAAAMARCVERHWPKQALLGGMVITRHGHAVPTERIEVIEAGHPLPDAAGLDAAQRLLDLCAGADENDLILALISGGGSSLLTLPASGLGLTDIQATTHALLRSGAPIEDINTVRKHLSRTLGGQLAAATHARVLALIVSDVAGDAPTHIASGPFAPDPTTHADALAVLQRWQVTVPDAVLHHLKRGAGAELADTAKAGQPCFAHVENRVIGNGHLALEAAAGFFAARGIAPVILGDTVTGEARQVAQAHAALAQEIRRHGRPWPAPVVVLSGGETSVTVTGPGRGGRNAEYLLSLALHLNGLTGTYALAADTDGIDGTEDNAGALIAPDSLARARQAGIDGQRCLADNDAYGFFAGLGDLLVTGPTLTNVNDYRAILLT